MSPCGQSMTPGPGAGTRHPLPKRRTGWFRLALALLLLAAPGPAGAWPLTVLDSLGRPVTLSRPPQRLVALSSSVADALRILRATNLLVGVEERIRENPAYWGELAVLPGVGRWNSPDLEAVASLRPDLVITYGSNPCPGLEERLGFLGIAVLRLGLNRLHSQEAEIGDLGRILGREAQAKEFLAWRRAALERIRALVATAAFQPRAYLESTVDFRAWGSGSTVDEMARAAGCVNLAGAVVVHRAEVTPEWVVAADPQIIIKTASSRGSYECAQPELLSGVRDAILARPGWGAAEAVRKGRVLVLAGDFFANLGAVVGVAHMAAFAHPELVNRLDPRALLREYLERFLGLPARGCHACSGGQP